MFRLEDGTVVEQEIFTRSGSAAVALAWRLAAAAPGGVFPVPHGLW
jgi:hypothetical protein